MSAYRRDFDGTKHMSLWIKGDELLEKYNEVCEKVKKSDTAPVYNENYLKAQIKSYN